MIAYGRIYKMKKLLGILVLGLLLITPSQADDIRDFEIEGMSIGDSALDYFTSEEFSQRKKYEYNYKNIFATIGFIKAKFKTYDKVQIHYKLNDKNKKIYGITGVIYFDNEIEECLNKKELIKSDIVSELDEFEEYNDTFKHWADPKGNSLVYQTSFDFSSGDGISIKCFDWSKQKTEEKLAQG